MNPRLKARPRGPRGAGGLRANGRRRGGGPRSAEEPGVGAPGGLRANGRRRGGGPRSAEEPGGAQAGLGPTAAGGVGSRSAEEPGVGARRA